MEGAEHETGKQTLVSVTRNFIALLRTARDSEVDLAFAEQRLHASRRRLYDIANVLEGAGLIIRCERSAVRWIGRKPDSRRLTRRQARHAREAEIDAMTESADRALASLSESERCKVHGWLSEGDIAKIDPNDALDLFAIRGPQSMTIEIVDDERSPCHIVCRTDQGSLDLIPIGKAAQRSMNALGVRACWRYHMIDDN
jgi:hypothetical protein